MTLTHDEQSLAAPYVLGALDAAERRAFEAHVATCASCRQELRDLQPIVDALAYAVPQRTPRPELRERVLRTVAGTATTRAPAPARAPRSWLPLAAAILLAAALGAAAWWFQARVAELDARLQDSERRAANAERQVTEARQGADDTQAALAILTAPDLVRIDLAGQPPAPRATARALWSRNNGMVFTATDLPPAPPGRVYQVWVVTAEAPVSAGLLAREPAGRATAVFRTPADIGTPVAAAVTLEPEGGVPAPTGDKYLIGTLHQTM
jgi:anti-sigma-K factor RskA